MKKIMIAVIGLVIVVSVFAYLNAGDVEDRLASQREALIYLKENGEPVLEVSFNMIEELEEHSIETTLRSSSAGPRDFTFKGVLLKDLLKVVDIDLAGKDQVITSAVDGYTVALSVDEVEEDDNVYIVYEIDEEPLKPREEGGSGPYQVVIRNDEFGQRWTKFLMEIDVN